MISFIFSLIIGLSAATLAWVIFMVEKDLSPNILKRLDRIKRKSNLSEEKEQEALDLTKADPDYKYVAWEKILKNLSFSRKIKELIQLSNIKWTIDTFVIFSLFFAFLPLVFLLTPFALMALCSIPMLLIPTIYLNFLANKRFLDFSRQFPDALNLMASSLRAGHPLFSAIDIVTTEMPSPICEVFETTKRDISLGIDTKDAFFSMTRVMPKSIDLRFFITAVLIQKEVGGNLAELLDKLSGTIRERFKLLGQLRTQTAQTRLSGMVLGIVPVGVLFAVFLLNPEYIKPLFNTNDGKIAFGSAILCIILGFVSIKKISNIEI